VVSETVRAFFTFLTFLQNQNLRFARLHVLHVYTFTRLLERCYRHAGCLQLSHVRTADPSADGRRA